MSRTGIRFFWTPVGRAAPVLRVFEYAPVAALLTVCVALTIPAESMLSYSRATARALYRPQGYIAAVLSARPLPTATNAARLGVPAPRATP